MMMNKPKYQIGDSYTSSHGKDVTIMQVYFSDRLNQYIYTLEQPILNATKVFVMSEEEIFNRVLEQDGKSTKI